MRLLKLVPALAVVALTDARTAPPVPTKEDTRRFGDAPIYVDGEARGVVRCGELPASLAPVFLILSDGRQARRYRVADYVQSLGVDLSRVRELHVHGGRGRVARVSGSELRRARERLLFSFSQGTRGKPRMHWAADVKITDAIDAIVAIAVYVEREPPRWNAETWRLELDGAPLDGIAYVRDELRGGTRVYLDGRLAGVLKKRNLAPELPVAAALATIGVDLGSVSHADLIADDDRVASFSRSQLARQRLVPIPQSGGRMAFAPAGATGNALLLRTRGR